MRRFIFVLSLIFMYTTVSSFVPEKIENVQFPLLEMITEMTADNKTDRVIGKYTDPDSGMQEYKPVKVKDVIECTYCPAAGGKEKILFKCYNGASDVIIEMEYVQPDYIRYLCSEIAGELTADDSLEWGIERISSEGFSEERGEHTVRVELTTGSGIITSESVNITKLSYNTSFELLDIYGERIVGPLVYLYWMKDGKSGHLQVEKKKIEDRK